MGHTYLRTSVAVTQRMVTLAHAAVGRAGGNGDKGPSTVVFGGYAREDGRLVVSHSAWLVKDDLEPLAVDMSGGGPSARAGHSCVGQGAQLVIFGGHDKVGTKLNDVWALCWARAVTRSRFTLLVEAVLRPSTAASGAEAKSTAGGRGKPPGKGKAAGELPLLDLSEVHHRLETITGLPAEALDLRATDDEGGRGSLVSVRVKDVAGLGMSRYGVDGPQLSQSVVHGVCGQLREAGVQEGMSLAKGDRGKGAATTKGQKAELAAPPDVGYQILAFEAEEEVDHVACGPYWKEWACEGAQPAASARSSPAPAILTPPPRLPGRYAPATKEWPFRQYHGRKPARLRRGNLGRTQRGPSPPQLAYADLGASPSGDRYLRGARGGRGTALVLRSLVRTTPPQGLRRAEEACTPPPPWAASSCSSSQVASTVLDVSGTCSYWTWALWCGLLSGRPSPRPPAFSRWPPCL